MDDDARRKDVAERAERIYQSASGYLWKGSISAELLIEVDSGDYEIVRDRDDYFDAGARLKARHEEPRVFVMKIGYRALARIGGARWRRDEV